MLELLARLDVPRLTLDVDGTVVFVKPWGAKEVETMEKAIVCFRCIGDRRLYKATATQPPALGEYRSRCGEKATLDLEARRVAG